MNLLVFFYRLIQQLLLTIIFLFIYLCVYVLHLGFFYLGHCSVISNLHLLGISVFKGSIFLKLNKFSFNKITKFSISPPNIVPVGLEHNLDFQKCVLVLLNRQLNQ